jgi:hypothetical protein
LLRLTKLLRVIRGMRILKKHEEKLGPSLSASMLIGTVVLAIHAITCSWYFVGTINTQTVNGTDIPGDASLGWVETMFEGSARLCSCHGADLGSNGERQTYFFDAFESKCMHPSDLGGETYDVCPGQQEAIPSPWDYYYKALFTALKDTSVKPGYLHSVCNSLDTERLSLNLRTVHLRIFAFGIGMGTPTCSDNHRHDGIHVGCSRWCVVVNLRSQPASGTEVQRKDDEFERILQDKRFGLGHSLQARCLL